MNAQSAGGCRSSRRDRLLATWLIVLVGCSAPAVAQNEGGAAGLYSRNAIRHIQIKMAPQDWQELRISHRKANLDQIAESTYVYYKADVVIDGEKFDSVGVRKKGFFGSVVSTRPSLKIRFDRYKKKQKLQGLDQITLNNNVQDPSQIHQYLTYWLFEKAGVAAPRCNFAVVTVNGENLGVYSNVESIRKPFLRRVFKGAKGDLYEGYAGDFVDGSDFDRIVHKRGRGDAGREHVAHLRDMLKESPVSLRSIEDVVNLDAFFRFWAVEVLIAHWDSYSGNRNNYYLFRNAKTKRFHFIPWGADSVFFDPGPFIQQPVPKSVKAVGILCRRLWEIPEARARYRKEMRSLLSDVFIEKKILAEMETVQKLLEPHITVDKARFRGRLESARSFIRNRRAEVEPELEQKELKWPDVKSTTDTPENPRQMVISGTFSTEMQRAGARPGSKGAFTVSIDGGEKLVFADVRVQALLEDPVFIRPGYPLVRLFGSHPGSKKPWMISFYVDPIRWGIEKPKLTVDHFAVWAMLVEGDPMSPTSNRRPFGSTGTLTLDSLEQKVGGSVSGSFTIRALAFDE